MLEGGLYVTTVTDIEVIVAGIIGKSGKDRSERVFFFFFFRGRGRSEIGTVQAGG